MPTIKAKAVGASVAGGRTTKPIYDEFYSLEGEFFGADWHDPSINKVTFHGVTYIVVRD